MDIQDIIKPENQVTHRPKSLRHDTLSYCPGCGHGVVTRIITEVIDELEIQSDTILVSSVGCSVFAYDYFDVDTVAAAHGRAPAVATGIKRAWPNKYVFTYQGDGDLAAIGTGETIHACNRGENITVIFINNGIYGMTGGQMAPTTLLGMKSSTSPEGRVADGMGHPLKITELIAQLPGAYFVSRQAVHTPSHVRKAKKAIKMAFDNQKLNKGTSFVEVVTNCNSNWKMSPVRSNEWLDEHMLAHYPLGDMKVAGETIQK